MPGKSLQQGPAVQSKETVQANDTQKGGRGNDFAKGRLDRNDQQTAQANTGELSGASWVAKFPTSTSTDDLKGTFKDDAKAFISALEAAGASVDIAATYRPPERAHLMHYAYKVANGVIAPDKVPAMAGVDINWVHPTRAASVSAAQAMVNGYEIVYAPALNSQHTAGKAVDMNISWSGTLKIKNKDGKEVSVGSPRNGASNTTLHTVGATYGVHKLVGDDPHWSEDGH